MKNTNRKADHLAKQEISNILLFEVSDDRLNFVTITDCRVSFDKSYADVYYTVDKDSYEKVQEALDGAKGYIRSLLSKRLEWRRSPELRFHRDETIDDSEAIESMIELERSHFQDREIEE